MRRFWSVRGFGALYLWVASDRRRTFWTMVARVPRGRHVCLGIQTVHTDARWQWTRSTVHLQSGRQVCRRHTCAVPWNIQKRAGVHSSCDSKVRDGYDPSDLLQRWENEGEYIFSEIPDEQEDPTSYLKVREAEGFKSVHFYFPNDLDATTPTTNHVVIDLPGFSSGLETFKKIM